MMSKFWIDLNAMKSTNIFPRVIILKDIIFTENNLSL